MIRILYVEENDDNVYMLSLRFEIAGGYEVLVAPDGLEGCRMAEAEQPDLILMDLDMPIMNGWDAARHLKADARTRHIPIIAVTAHAMAGAREEALAAGCDDFDTKPIDFDRLLHKVATLLSTGISDQTGS